MKQLAYVAARLRELSTYSGLTSLVSLGVLFHLLPETAVQPVVHDIIMIGTGVGGLLGLAAVLLPDGMKLVHPESK
jgi:hypothetical protein